jgi:ribonuclease T1
MKKRTLILLFAFLSLFISSACNTPQTEPQKPVKQEIVKTETLSKITENDLPKEASIVLMKINSGSYFKNKKDGAVFGNYEKRLPIKPRGYYQEYTVKTPGERSRGAKRIVIGKSGEKYYTDDHYKTFKEIIK